MSTVRDDAWFYARLRLAGGLVAAGILVEVATLWWTHPLTFVAFILGGGSLVGIGIVVYLWALVSR